MNPTDPLPISLVAHTVFCPRRAWLEAVGETVPSPAIEAGLAAHINVDNRADPRSQRCRSMDVTSQELDLVGKCDTVVQTAGELEVVEYKAAPLRRTPTVTRAQIIQLALQTICLAEAGYNVASQSVYFTNHRKTVQVHIGPQELEAARAYVRQTREIVESPTAPPPLEQDPRCNRCSHSSICLPDERDNQPTSRRIAVSDPDGHVLHLLTPGARASLGKGRIRVVKDDETLMDLPLETVAGLVVHGNVDISTALIRELLWRKLCIVWCSPSGRVVGFASSSHSPNGLPRVRQHLASALGDLTIARELVAPKIANQATLLRRASRSDHQATVTRLRAAAQRCAAATSLNELFGLEGDAAALYFAALPDMLATGPGDWYAARWPGRQGRAATDPTNVALNYAYSLLLADTIRALLACGLDPHAGFLHSSSRNKPALALDLMEQFRTPIADSAVIGAINNGELKPNMFSNVLGPTRLRDPARRILIAAYERRIETPFRHPTYRYRVTWRRAIEVQARMLLGLIDGTQSQYRGIRIR